MSRQVEVTLTWLGVDVWVLGDYSPRQLVTSIDPPEEASFDITEVFVDRQDIRPMLECMKIQVPGGAQLDALEELAIACLEILE